MSINPFDLLKNFQDIQSKSGEIEEQLRSLTASGMAGGMVEVVVNGHLEIVDVKIDKMALDLKDSEMLQDLIKSAVNSGVAAAKEAIKEKVSSSFPLGELSSLKGNSS